MPRPIETQDNHAGYYPLRQPEGMGLTLRNPFFASEDLFGTLASPAPQLSALGMNVLSSNYAPGNAEIQGRRWAQQWPNMPLIGSDEYESVDARQKSAVPSVTYYCE